MKNDTEPSTSSSDASVISIDLFVDSLLNALKLSPQPASAKSVLLDLALTGDLKASICLTKIPRGESPPIDEGGRIATNIFDAAENGDQYATYIAGNLLMDNGYAEHGLHLWHKASDSGVAEATWAIARYYANKNRPEAYEYAVQAGSCGYKPAASGACYAADIARQAVNDANARSESKVRSIEKEKNRLAARLADLESQHTSEKTSLLNQMSSLEARRQKAEGIIKDLKADVLCDKTIVDQQFRIRQLEDGWLETQCSLEAALAKISKLESTLDDLLRSYRHAVSLLRKNGIPFIERFWELPSNEAA
jgi:hypothetical protein